MDAAFARGLGWLPLGDVGLLPPADAFPPPEKPPPLGLGLRLVGDIHPAAPRGDVAGPLGDVAVELQVSRRSVLPRGNAGTIAEALGELRGLPWLCDCADCILRHSPGLPSPFLVACPCALDVLLPRRKPSTNACASPKPL
mmetsp:Transcript_51125/g.119763  ORF Transcript_51125/g.119763 Transcript_51125/m.119763 type:complete len:141 (-) Transcript_51125:84-506(-)